MAITITSSGTYTVVPGQTYIIHPSVEGTVKFEYGSGTVPVDFTVQLRESPTDPSKSVKIETYDEELNPTLQIVDGYNGPKTEIDFDKAAGSTIEAYDDPAVTTPEDDNGLPDNVTLKELKGSKDGTDDWNFGTDLTIATKTIDLGGTKTLDMDSFVAGDGFEAKDIKGGDGDNEIILGDDAEIEKIETKDGDDVIEIGDGATGPKPSKGIEIKTGEGDDTLEFGNDGILEKLDMGKGADDATVGAFDPALAVAVKTITLDGGKSSTKIGGTKVVDQDSLTLDLSWLTPAQLTAFRNELVLEGYVPDGMGGFTFEDADGDGLPDEGTKITFKFEVGGETVKLKLEGWESINVICFARGTRIATQRGEVAIEDLGAGDMVLTMDRGYQEIRWIGSTRVPRRGKLAPVRIKAGTMGNARDLVVSPQHRILVKGPEIEMLFGQSEALVAAKHLINGESIVREEGGEVEYFHMLFDDHEIVFAEGTPSESFHPGAVGLDGMAEEARSEIFALFPELEADVTAYGASCRMSLKGYEAKAALTSRAAAPAVYA
jgi:hypothetical protein